MKIAVVFGTRPEVIKLSKVVEEMRRRGVEPTLIGTGQHTSLLRGTPAESTMAPHVSLGLASNNDPMVYARDCDKALDVVFREQRPEWVVVQGDTASAHAGASAACYLEIPVAHVEAGIRSGDRFDPWPEEGFRVTIDRIAQRWFCATEHNVDNLLAEDLDHPGAPFPYVSGNSGIDALYSHTKPTTEVQDRVLITLHRRESFGEPLKAIVRGLLKGAIRAHTIEFCWPIHANPRVWDALEVCREAPATNVLVGSPMRPELFAKTLSTCRAVITDSGGVQEEAAALGIPCIVAREKTDRPESVTAGIAKVVGRTEQGILDGLDWALGFSTRPDPSTCFGDGHASPRIVSHLLENA